MKFHNTFLAVALIATLQALPAQAMGKGRPQPSASATTIEHPTCEILVMDDVLRANQYRSSGQDFYDWLVFNLKGSDKDPGPSKGIEQALTQKGYIPVAFPITSSKANLKSYNGVFEKSGKMDSYTFTTFYQFNESYPQVSIFEYAPKGLEWSSVKKEQSPLILALSSPIANIAGESLKWEISDHYDTLDECAKHASICLYGDAITALDEQIDIQAVVLQAQGPTFTEEFHCYDDDWKTSTQCALPLRKIARLDDRFETKYDTVTGNDRG